MWEFRAYGSGDLYHDIFNAVALMSGANAMDSLIRLVLVLGVAMAIVKAVTDFNIGSIVRWFLFATIIYGVLWVPKVTVQVEDRLDPAAVYPTVANVPLGVGLSASLVSQVGDRIIKLTETAFADPADGQFSSHGMVFGAKMFAKINALRPADQRTALNVRAYMQDCALYDIEDNTVQIDALSRSADMWQTLTASPNPARMASYTAGDGSTSLKSCSDFVTAVNTDLGNDLPNVQKYLVASVDPDAAEGGMNAQEANVSGVVATAIGSSQDAMTILKQAVVRNTLNDSLKGYMGTSSGVLGATMAELQTANTQRLLGVVAEKAVVNLKIVIELLFIGIFPVIFPLFLLPKLGPAMAKGYLAGFFYLQLWGPMYVILHKVMMANAYAHTASATFGSGGTHVFNALTLDAAAQANQDVCTLAGSMMLMIPVLAGLLTKGAMAVGAQGEALLGNFRSGAESASSSLTSGNWSLGNTAVENHSWSNESANQHVTSRYEDRSRSTAVGSDGVTLTRYGSGLTIANGAVSSGALDLARQEGYSESLSRTSQSYLDDSRSLTDAISVGKTRSKTVMDEVFRGWSNNTVNLSGMSSEEQASSGRVISDLQQLSRYYQTSHHMSKSEADAEATRAGVTAYAQAEAGGDVGFASAKAGVKGEASKDASTTATQAKSNDQGFSLTQSLSTEIADTHNRISTDAARSAYDRSHSSDSGQRHVDSSSFSSLESITDTATRLRATGNRLSEDAANVRNGSESVSGNEGTAFFNWMIQEKGLTVADARRLWIGANASDLNQGMALAKEYNSLQADSLAAKYDAAATPTKSDIPLTPDLANAEKVTDALHGQANLRAAVGAPSRKPARSKRNRGPKSAASDTPPTAGWQPQAQSLDGSPQAAAFTQRNVSAASTTDAVNQGVAHGETTLENQQVREHINITDQGAKTFDKIKNSTVRVAKSFKKKEDAQ